MSVRVCPKRDAVCPHGMGCPYVIDRYDCKPEAPPMNSPDVRERIARIISSMVVRSYRAGAEKFPAGALSSASSDAEEAIMEIIATLSPDPLVEALKETSELLNAIRDGRASIEWEGVPEVLKRAEAALLSTGLASGDQGTSGASLPAHVAEDATATETPCDLERGG